MPWKIEKLDGEFCVFKKDTNEKLKCYPTEKEAQDYMAALYANEPEKSLTPKEGGTEEVGQLTVHDKHPKENKTLYSFPIQIMELKSIGEDWYVEGYQSTWGNKDLVDDIVMTGAFTKTLQRGRKRFFVHHDPRLIPGVPKKLYEDTKGLFGSFKFSKTQLGEETHELVKDGALDSFSIGYRPVDYEYDDSGIRYLKEIELYECSLVAIPANEQAIVTGYKNYMDMLNLTLASKTNYVAGELSELLNDLRGLTDKNRPLSEKKQQEIMELLDTLSGMDAVRSELQSLLTAQPSSLVESHRLKYLMAELRKRHPEFIKE